MLSIFLKIPISFRTCYIYHNIKYLFIDFIEFKAMIEIIEEENFNMFETIEYFNSHKRLITTIMKRFRKLHKTIRKETKLFFPKQETYDDFCGKTNFLLATALPYFCEYLEKYNELMKQANETIEEFTVRIKDII